MKALTTTQPWVSTSKDNGLYNIMPLILMATANDEFTGELHKSEAAIVVRDQKIPDNRGVAGDYEFLEDDVCRIITDQATKGLKSAKDLLKYAQKAIAILTIDGSMDGDVNNWDMEHLAKLGILFDSMFVDIDNNVYTMDHAVAQWTNQDGEMFDFHVESGEPCIERDGTVIKGMFKVLD